MKIVSNYLTPLNLARGKKKQVKSVPKEENKREKIRNAERKKAAVLRAITITSKIRQNHDNYEQKSMARTSQKKKRNSSR